MEGKLKIVHVHVYVYVCSYNHGIVDELRNDAQQGGLLLLDVKIT